MAKLTLKNKNPMRNKSFVFTQDDLDNCVDFETAVDWLVAHPDNAHGMIGRSEFHDLMLVNDYRGWSIIIDGEEVNEYTDDAVNVVRDWVEAVIERADWDYSEHVMSIPINLTYNVTVTLSDTTVDFRGEVPGVEAKLEFDRDTLEEELTRQIAAALLSNDAFGIQATEVEHCGSWAQIGFANRVEVKK